MERVDVPAQPHRDDMEGDPSRAWDGGAAMLRCATTAKPASTYSAICAGKRAGDPEQQSSWALPHHDHAGGPASHNGVANALARLDSTQGLTNKEAARAHLEAHMKTLSKGDAKNGEKRETEHSGLNLRSLEPQSGKPRPAFYRQMVNSHKILLRDSDSAWGNGKLPTMTGHFCVFNRWTHIDSFFEGEFMERIAPGATVKTIKENRDQIKVLFNHGNDPAIGKKVLGPIEDIREDEIGTGFEVPLLDTQYNRDLVPGLEQGLYGTSFRFRVMKEEVNNQPKRSDYNPEGIPERTVQEMEVAEFGPVTFPQYPEATVGMRSLTDDLYRMELFDALISDPEKLIVLFGQERLRTLLASVDPSVLAVALSNGGAEGTRSGGSSLPAGSRDEGEKFSPLVVIRNPNRTK